MSPVFRHGRLRLYLLRLLDEEPRHGYEVIRLLRDRFMGVYAPSPGTIYPRLARLEEEGLVTHDEADGRKVYRITDAGREELRERGDELTELEQELDESVSDIVREVGEDVRETVRSLREELTRAARTAWRGEEQARTGYSEAPPGRHPRDWGLGGRWGRGRGWGEWPSVSPAPPRPGAPGGPGWPAPPGWRGWQERDLRPGGPDARVARGLERIVREFTGDLARLAWQAGASVREEALGGLRSILDDTLDRISDEIFGTASPRTRRNGTREIRSVSGNTENPAPRTGAGTGAGTGTEDAWGQATGTEPAESPGHETGGQPGSGPRGTGRSRE